MSVEIWGMDSGAGMAILRREGRWLSVSIDDAWRPVEMDASDVVRYLLSGGMSRLGIHFDIIEDAVVACRRARRLALESGDPSDVGLRRTFATQPTKSASERQALAAVAGNLYRLDGFFRRHGQSGEESFRLLLELLDHLEVRSATQKIPEGNLPLAELFGMAADIVEKVVPKGGALGTASPPASGGVQRWGFERLSNIELSCLALWADGDSEPERIGRLLRLPAGEVEGAIAAAMHVLGANGEALRSTEVAAACRQELERRLDLT